MSYGWGDPARQVAQYTMDLVQQFAGSTADGRPRNAAPYFTFGAREFTSQTPTTQLPAIQWRQAAGHFDTVRVVAGAGTTGSLGSWILDFEVNVYGSTRSMVFDEVLYLVQSLRQQQQSNPPVNDIVGRWLDPGQAKQNAKEAMVVTFSVPVIVPVIPQLTETILVISSSLELPPLSGSSTGLPPVTGSYLPAVRSIVVR